MILPLQVPEKYFLYYSKPWVCLVRALLETPVVLRDGYSQNALDPLCLGEPVSIFLPVKRRLFQLFNFSHRPIVRMQ